MAEYQFRTLDDAAKREHLNRQLQQAEFDIYTHSLNAQLAGASGNTQLSEQLTQLANEAQARAELTCTLLDELPAEETVTQE